MTQSHHVGFEKQRSFGAPKVLRPGLVCTAKVFPDGLLSRLLWPFLRMTINVMVGEDSPAKVER